MSFREDDLSVRWCSTGQTTEELNLTHEDPVSVLQGVFFDLNCIHIDSISRT